MFCKRCRYNLKGVDKVCPECGRAFDAVNPKTYRKRVGLPKFVRRLLQGLAVLFVGVLIALGVIEWRYQRELAAAGALDQVGGHIDWSVNAHQWADGISFLHGRLQHVDRFTLVFGELTTLPSEIGKLANMTGLDLRWNQLTSLPPEIGQLAKLERLYLYGSPITDADLEHLKSLVNLKELGLGTTNVTKQGVAKIRLALPHCEIISDFDAEKP